MLILALFLVLFSNYMEERLQDGKSVLRMDCCCTTTTPMDTGDRGEDRDDTGDRDDEERSPLLSSVILA